MCCLFLFTSLALAGAMEEIPDAMMGTWLPAEGMTTQAIIGPSKLFSSFSMSKDQRNGDVWFSAINGQVFHVRNGLMQYCFYVLATSPFFLNTTESTKVVFCYKDGARMKSHRRLDNGNLATGCDAARITLELKNDVLEFTFEMSPPVRHAWVQLKRVGPPPPISHYQKAGACDPTHPGPPTLEERASEKDSHAVLASMCPRMQKQPPVMPNPTSMAGSVSQGAACKQLDAISRFLPGKNHVDIKLYHSNPQNYCWPCKVTYAVSAGIQEDEYVAIGFKGMAYRAELLFGGQRPCYFGMCADEVDEARTTGIIALGHASSSGPSCLREMKATAYIGTPVDVPGNPHLQSTKVERVNGRTFFEFTIEQHAGRNALEINSFFNMDQFSMRVMWAIGKMGNVANCTAEPQFHSKRGVSPLGWFYQNPNCMFDDFDSSTMNATEAARSSHGGAIVV